MDWEVSLSNGETFNNKQMYREGDVTPFRRLIRYAVENGYTFTSVKMNVNGSFYHLPIFNDKAKYPSSDITEKWWFSTTERWAGFGGLTSMEKVESISYRLGDRRIYHIVNQNGNIWQRVSLLNDPDFKDNHKYPCGISEVMVDSEYLKKI